MVTFSDLFAALMRGSFDPDFIINYNASSADKDPMLFYRVSLGTFVFVSFTHCSNPEVRIRKKMQPKLETAVRTPMKRVLKRAPT